MPDISEPDRGTAAGDDMPAAEVDIDTHLVRRLLAAQFPDLARLPLVELAFGWDNALFRLGDDLLVRLPRREMAAPLVAHEQRWLPRLAPSLPLPIPAPVGSGSPGEGFPWPWSICPYLPGRSVLSLVDGGGSLADPPAEARRIGAFLRALHRPAPSDAPHNPVRGVPLADRDERTREYLVRMRGRVDVDLDALDRIRAAALEVPGWDRPPVWVHGDTHPGNLLTDGARITAVIDLGDICGGDPASDLVLGWMLFEGDARAEFRTAVDADDDTWRRGHGWALAIGTALLATSADNPPYRRLGAHTIAGVLADA